jgi:adenosylcobinamide-GDP ribazoletransferase
VKALRLSVGLLTIIPVGAIGDVDRRLARSAMLVAPFVGLLLGALGAVVLVVVQALVPSTLGSLLAAVLAIASITYLTRALHIDGLADTADALGSGKEATAALEIARRGDVGPFGVVTVVLALLVQVTALAIATDAGTGALALVVALVTGRVAIVIACARGIPAARPEGLGAIVAGTVPKSAAIAWVLVSVGAAGAASAWLAGTWIVGAVAVIAALGVGLLVVARAVRRLGGITGDVLGALAEVASTMALLLMATLTYASALTS